MKHLLIIGHTPPTISPNYSHKTWFRLSALIQQHLLDHPSYIPVSSLALGWETIAAEIAVRLNRPFICHSIPPDHQPPKDWCSADKMTYINSLLEASQITQEPWPRNKTNAVLAFWNGKENRVGRALHQLRLASIPITNLYIPSESL